VWQTPTITKPEIRTEITMSCLMKRMLSVRYKAAKSVSRV